MKDKLINLALQTGKNVLESINNILIVFQIGFLIGIGVFTAFYTFVAIYGWLK